MRVASTASVTVSIGARTLVTCATALLATSLTTVPTFGQNLGQNQPRLPARVDLTRALGYNGIGDWEILVTPYVWASGIDGTVGLRDRTAEIDISFRELLDHLEGAFMLPVEARSGRWGLGLEVIYVKVGDRDATPGPLFSSAKLTARQSIVEFGPRYRVTTNAPIAVDMLAGGRWWSLSNKLELESGALPGREFELDKGWIDPFVGVRIFGDFSSRWLLQARGDVGGFDVGSRFSWQLIGTVGYVLGSRWTLRAGYRQLDVDFSDDDDDFLYDVGIGGWILGATYNF